MVINDFCFRDAEQRSRGAGRLLRRGVPAVRPLPSVVKRQNSFLFGRNAIEMYLPQQVHVRGFGMLDPRVVVNERTVNFYADYNGTIIHALARSRTAPTGSCSPDDSLIRELVIRPA